MNDAKIRVFGIVDKIVAQLNMDMVGRNDKNDPKEANTVYLVGSDRISTELHNLNEEANASLKPPSLPKLMAKLSILLANFPAMLLNSPSRFSPNVTRKL